MAECLTCRTLQRWINIFNYEWSWSVTETQVRIGQVRCAQAPVIKPESPKVGTRHCRRCQRAWSHGPLNIPTPDYSRTPSKVDCWRKNSIIGVEENKVSGAVSCSVVQM
jgi:hypothetical protein